MQLQGMPWRCWQAIWIALALAACTGGGGAPTIAPAEDCETEGDEDGNGLADCHDPACSAISSCRSVCGNARQDTGEQCDDGNPTSGDGCDSNCTVTACGNGIVTDGEACDDGNSIDGDGCDSNCTITACGNGIVTEPEECDGRGTNYECDSNCRIAACGNGFVGKDEICDDGNLIDGDGCDSNCTVTACGNGVITTGEVCDDGNLTDGDGCDSNCAGDMDAYLKASNTDGGDLFGDSVALSADGTTLAIGAAREASSARGIDGDQTDNTATTAGAVYVFVRDGAVWRQQAYIKASNPGAVDAFGQRLALSADGSTLVVAALLEDSAATGVDGDQADNTSTDSGAVYVFARTGTTWTQQAYLKASNRALFNHLFGTAVALSADGTTVAVGARDDSATTGINGDQSDHSAPESGAVYVFTRSGTTWSQQAYIKASNTRAGTLFGCGGVGLSADGATLAVGGVREASAATGINGDQSSTQAGSSGAVYVFTRTDTIWSQQAYIKASNTNTDDVFGIDLAVSGDGSTLAVAALESSAAIGIDGDQADNSAERAGAVYVFTRIGTIWSQQAYVKASNTEPDDLFRTVALSGDGSTLAVGADQEDSAATRVDGDQADNSARESGAVYLFKRSGTTWRQQAYVKAFNTAEDDLFGAAVALSGDGSMLAVGAPLEDSAATGVGGNQTNNLADNAGAVYVYR